MQHAMRCAEAGERGGSRTCRATSSTSPWLHQCASVASSTLHILPNQAAICSCGEEVNPALSVRWHNFWNNVPLMADGFHKLLIIPQYGTSTLESFNIQNRPGHILGGFSSYFPQRCPLGALFSPLAARVQLSAFPPALEPSTAEFLSQAKRQKELKRRKNAYRPS